MHNYVEFHIENKKNQQPKKFGIKTCLKEEM